MPASEHPSITYIERVNRAIDHVMANLDKPPRLAEVARAAMLSPFHFHRVFQSATGETLADFVKRKRLDKALTLMAHGPRRSLSNIALDCGFASSSDFSRCFKQRFGVPPRSFDLDAWRAAHGAKLEQVVEQWAAAHHIERLPASPLSTNPDGFVVTIRDLPARTVAYVRAHNPYHGGVGLSVIDAFACLTRFADRNGLGDGQWLGFQWEHPELTPLEQCVYHAALVIPPERLVATAPTVLQGWEGQIGRYDFPPMRVAEIRMSGGIDLELRLFQWFYSQWLPRSGYVPDDHPGFEAFLGRPFAHGHEHFELAAHIPVRRG